jgi:hypothetical protein
MTGQCLIQSSHAGEVYPATRQEDDQDKGQVNPPPPSPRLASAVARRARESEPLL